MLNKELDQHKKLVLQVLLLFTGIAGIIFALMNSSRQLYVLASVEMISACVSLWLLMHLKNTQSHAKLKRLALIYVVLFFSVMMLAFSIKGVSVSIFVWVLVIPLISYLLLGVKTGFMVTCFFYSVTLVLYSLGYTDHPEVFAKVSYANFVICALLFWGLSHSYEHANQTAKKKLKIMAIYDHLTGLYNRSMFSRIFNKYLLQFEGKPLSLLLFDLDNFKSINDQFGHGVGDEVLQAFADIIKQQVVDKGVAFRLGGEEFAVILPALDAASAKPLAEEVRQLTEHISIDGLKTPLVVTVSVGLTSSMVEQANINSMLKMADKYMYEAKDQGRNRVVMCH